MYESNKFHSDFALEGGITHSFIQKAWSGHTLDGKKVLEVGPKHGYHTKLLLSENPELLQLVEMPGPAEQRVTDWVKNLQKFHSCLQIDFENILNYETPNKFDYILFAGVIYHNLEQIKMCKKLHDLANDNCKLIVESSTTRTLEYMDKNIVEVHWPIGYRDMETVRFHPSKLALKSMLEMSGWEIEKSSDEFENLKKDDRVNFSCKRVKLPVPKARW